MKIIKVTIENRVVMIDVADDACQEPPPFSTFSADVQRIRRQENFRQETSGYAVVWVRVAKLHRLEKGHAPSSTLGLLLNSDLRKKSCMVIVRLKDAVVEVMPTFLDADEPINRTTGTKAETGEFCA